MESLRDDFAQREFQHQHVMNALGQCLVMRQLNIQLTQQHLQWIESILHTFYNYQNGAFNATYQGEFDCRTTYAGLVLYNTLKINKPEPTKLDQMTQKTAEFLLKQLNKGGFGIAEPHLAYTYCAVAGLRILEQIHKKQYLTQNIIEDIATFTIQRQTEFGGFNGRPNKHVDGCYTFWAIGTLKLLGIQYLELIQKNNLVKFCINCCHDENGGLRDKPGVEPDSYHSCYVLGGLWCLMGGNALELGIE